MSSSSREEVFRVAALSAVKHGYVPEGVHAHPRFEVVVVADDVDRPDWTHERNQKLADDLGVPYLRDVEKALSEYDAQVAVVSSEAERHCDLSVRAADKGLHIVQDKPMSTNLSECDRVVESIERNGVKFLMWNRNTMPAVLQAHDAIKSGAIGEPYAVHVDFYFAKDAGPPKTSNEPGNPPIDWLEALKAAHADGGDGGVGSKPMGELEIEGIYPLAHVLMLTGARVRRVFARTSSHFHQRNVDNDIDDLSTVTLEMDGGVLGTLSMGRTGAGSHPDSGGIKIHVLGSNGALVFDEPSPEVMVFHRGITIQDSIHQRVGGEYDFLLMEDFANAIDTDGDTMLNAQASRDIAATVEAAIESGKTGKPVDVR